MHIVERNVKMLNRAFCFKYLLLEPQKSRVSRHSNTTKILILMLQVNLQIISNSLCMIILMRKTINI